jgi:cell division GTPase FtsZ
MIKSYNNPIIIGIGGSGQAIVRECIRNNINANYVILDNTPHAFAMPLVRIRSKDPDHLYDIDDIENEDLQKKLSYAYFNYEGLKKYNEKLLNNIDFQISNLKHDFEKYEPVILVNGLGGQFGTTMARKFFNDLYHLNKDFYWINSLPFPFEGKHKMKIAKSFTEDIPGLAKVITFDSENILSGLSKLEAFSISNKYFLQRIISIINKNE